MNCCYSCLLGRGIQKLTSLFFVALPLAISQYKAEWGGGYDPPAEDL